MKIGVISDLHLGHRQYGLREREFDFYNQLDSCVKELNKHHCKIVIIAGDIFDKPNPSPEAIHKYNDIIGNLASDVIIAIKGNHTMLLRDDHYAVDELVAEEYENYFLLEDENWNARDFAMGSLYDMEFKDWIDKKINIDGITYRGAIELKEFIDVQKKMASNIDDDDSFNILVVHQAFKEFCGFTNEELSINDIDYSPYDVIICGHIHSRKNTFLDEDTIFLQPGSIERLNTEEARDESKKGKGVYVIDTNKHICDFYPIRSDRVFYLGNVFLSSSDEIKEHFKYLQESIDSQKLPPILSQSYDIPQGCYKLLYDEIANVKNILVNKSNINRSVDDNIELVITENEIPPVPKVVKMVGEDRYNKNEAQLCVDLLNNCESQENLKEIIDNFFEKNYSNEVEESDFDEHACDELYAYFENLEV